MSRRAFLFAIVAVTYACVGDDPVTSAGVTDAEVTDAGAGTEEEAPPPTTCDTVYVAASGGVDTGDGCSQKTPKSTIVSALRSAKERGAREVHVCEGTYVEAQLVVDFAVSLRGGYDCSSWGRAPEEKLRDENRTIIKNGNYALGKDTVKLNGTTLGRDSVFEGFVVEGGDVNDPDGARATNGAIALHSVGTSMRILRSRFLGGAAENGGSNAVSVENGNPEVAFCHLDGGSGKVGGSMGFFAHRATPYLHDNVILGGRGESTGGVGSIGMNLTRVGDLDRAHGTAIERNDIRAGSGSSNRYGSVGAYVYNDEAAVQSKIEFVQNRIDGGTGKYIGPVGQSDSAGAWGVYISDYAQVTRVRFEGNRIFAGKHDATGTAPAVGAHGMVLRDREAELVNNVIAAEVAPSVPSSDAVRVVLGRLIARNNTFLGASSNALPSVGGGGGVVYFDGTVQKNNVLENNLFLHRATAPDEAAVVISGCSAQQWIGIFENNFFSLPAAILGHRDASCGGSLATIDEVESELRKAPSAIVRNNRRVTPPACITYGDGGVESGCIATPVCGDGGTTACGQTLFSAFQSDGVTELLDGKLLLRPNTYCAVREGGKDVTSDETVALPVDAGPDASTDAGIFMIGGLKTDFFGATRSVPLSVGAQELDDGGACP